MAGVAPGPAEAPEPGQQRPTNRLLLGSSICALPALPSPKRSSGFAQAGEADVRDGIAEGRVMTMSGHSGFD